MVGQGQVCLVQEKVRTVKECVPLTTKKELMSFLGLVGYYHSFCKDFSTVVVPTY